MDRRGLVWVTVEAATLSLPDYLLSTLCTDTLAPGMGSETTSAAWRARTAISAQPYAADDA